MRDPRVSPQTGDIVVAQVGGDSVTRTIMDRNEECVTYQDNRIVNDQVCWIEGWREWCKEHEAHVIEDDL